MKDDASLLRRYAEEGSEPAFAELVRRHLDLVYRAALRRTAGDAHRAADVAQQVFTALAREARRLADHAVLEAWLHTATRNAALNLMISEQRRQARELAAQALASAPADASLDWERLRPELDSAIDELPEPDRAAVVLRFLEQRPFAEVGAALRVSEDAARVRTGRALDKLRDVLARRGITSTAAALGALVSGQPLISAPAGLAFTLAARSLATAGAAGTAATATTFMSLKLLTTASVSALAAFGAGAYVGFSQNFDPTPPPPIETPRHSELIASLRKDNATLRAEVDKLSASITRLRAAPPPAAVRPATNSAITMAAPVSDVVVRENRKKAIMNNLRQLAAAIDQFQLENGRPPTSLDEIVGETKYIRRLNPVFGESYTGNALVPGGVLSATDSEGMLVSYDTSNNAAARTAELAERQRVLTPEQLRVEELSKRIAGPGKRAVEAYRAAHGQPPPNAEALIPYFATPQEGADFVEFIEAQKAAQRTRQ